MATDTQITLREMAERLARAESALARLNGTIYPVRRPLPKRLVIRLAVAVGLMVLAGANVVIADSPPLAGELVPRQIPYRGYIEQNGAPVTGQLDMTFELYPDGTSATPLWSETRTVAMVAGAFNVDLGDCNPASNCPLGPLATALAATPASLYLAIRVAGNALAGRQRIMSAPYAERAAWASTATTAVNAQRGVPGASFAVDSSLLISGNNASGAEYNDWSTSSLSIRRSDDYAANGVTMMSFGYRNDPTSFTDNSAANIRLYDTAQTPNAERSADTTELRVSARGPLRLVSQASSVTIEPSLNTGSVAIGIGGLTVSGDTSVGHVTFRGGTGPICVFANACPEGWTSHGDAGFILNSATGTCPYTQGGNYANTVWYWCHPSLCCNQ